MRSRSSHAIHGVLSSISLIFKGCEESGDSAAERSPLKEQRLVEESRRLNPNVEVRQAGRYGQRISPFGRDPIANI